MTDGGKVTQFPNPRQIEAEACAWIAQLDGAEPTAEDLAAFREWMGRSQRHRDEIRRLSAMWSDLNVLTQLAVPLQQSRRAGRRRLLWGSAAAAMVAVACAAAGLFWWYPSSAPRDGSAPGPVYSTAVGEQRTVTLADGSTVLLNTDSRIRIEYTPRRRDVRLLRGEAYFTVAHDRTAPFSVLAGANIVRAVGTAFAVHVRERDVDVVVEEGVVELSSVAKAGGGPGAGQPTVTRLAALEAGQSATVSRALESIQTMPPAEVGRMLSWRQGVLSFSGESLDQVVEEVGRYTPVKIVISDPAIRDIAVGGLFKAGETDALFEALETSFGVRVERVNDRLVYLAAK